MLEIRCSVRDTFVVTDERIIIIDHQGVTGKNTEGIGDYEDRAQRKLNKLTPVEYRRQLVI